MRTIAALLAVCLSTSAAFAQSTQGLIRGRIQDALTGHGIPGARIEYSSTEAAQNDSVISNRQGNYFLPSLSPGIYHLRVVYDGYQPQDIFDVEVSVAAFLEADFRLRRISDVWEAGQYRSVFGQGSRGVVSLIGPDFDSARVSSLVLSALTGGKLEAAISTVIPIEQIRELPLSGRDAYALLVTHPGVVTDSGTARGLGLSVNGLRPSSSSFLLDGVENNNHLVTGPLIQLAPEAIQEYRISSNLFSAEYGRAGAYLANAVTQPGGNEWHGTPYFYAKNEFLDANAWQRNRLGYGRARNREIETGLSLGGPVRKGSSYVSGFFEVFENAAKGDPVTLNLPTTNYRLNTTSQSLARKLLDGYCSLLPVGKGLVAPLTFEPPVDLQRRTALLRADRTFNGDRDRLLIRLMGARLKRPDFIWSPYQDYSSPLYQTSYGLLAGVTLSLRPNLMWEGRLSYTADDLHWGRAQGQVPTLSSSEADSDYPLVLPGSPAFYGYRNRSGVGEALGNLLWIKGRHIAKFGGGILERRVGGHLTTGSDGEYSFPTIVDFFRDAPETLRAGLKRSPNAGGTSEDADSGYRNRQFHLFAQDSWTVSRRLVLNAGLRYENFGVPVADYGDAGSKVELGTGANLLDRVSSGHIGTPLREGNALYDSDNNNLAGRLGFAWQLDENTALRGGYGIFFDRPFDNLWQNLRLNSVELIARDIPARLTPINYLSPPSGILKVLPGTDLSLNFPEALLFQPKLKDAYIQSYFISLERKIGDSWRVEASTLGSLGRKLITSDRINRGQQLNPDLPVIVYRANQGSSRYSALNLNAQFRSGSAFFKASYTYGSSRDNQSEPLAGDFFDLNFTRANFREDRPGVAAFSRQLDSSSDRGRSDFDQRHNLTLQGFWILPGPLNGWHIAGLAALRSGFPFSVLAPTQFDFDTATIYNNRAELIEGQSYRSRQPVDGGVRLLNPGAFTSPAAGQVSSLPRNSFTGPGLYNVDLAVSRKFRLTERMHTVLRADAFNFLNHANLNPPDTQLDSPTFGVALYGRKGRGSGFPALIPFDETARRLQIMLRLEF